MRPQVLGNGFLWAQEVSSTVVNGFSRSFIFNVKIFF
jgi:hypothetical protein